METKSKSIHRTKGKIRTGRPRGALALAVRNYNDCLSRLLWAQVHLTVADLRSEVVTTAAKKRDQVLEETRAAAANMRRLLFAAPLGRQADSRGQTVVVAGNNGSRCVIIGGVDADGPYQPVSLHRDHGPADTDYIV
jgi:hypothetical protein